jgi:hypothetical protein
MPGWKTSSHLVDDPLLGLRLVALLTEKVGEMGEARMKEISYGDPGKAVSMREHAHREFVALAAGLGCGEAERFVVVRVDEAVV